MAQEGTVERLKQDKLCSETERSTVSVQHQVKVANKYIITLNYRFSMSLLLRYKCTALPVLKSEYYLDRPVIIDHM